MPCIFFGKKEDHRWRLMRRKKRLIPPAKMTKRRIITISVYQNTRWERECNRLSLVIIIKLSGLAEDQLCQITIGLNDSWSYIKILI